MFVNFGHVIQALLFALGVYWCYAVIVRFSDDIKELSEVEDRIRKAVIVGIWAVTVVIAILVVKFVISVVGRIASGLPGLEVLF